MKIKKSLLILCLIALPILAQNIEIKNIQDKFQEISVRIEKCIIEQENRLKIQHNGTPGIKTIFELPFLEALYNHNTNSVFVPIGSVMGNKVTTATLHHELAHFYCDKISEEAGLGNFGPDKTMPEHQQTSTRLIAEGIAEYFEKFMTDKERDNFEDSEWYDMSEEKSDDVKYRTIYDGGYHLVKPIIDRFGVEKSVKYFIFHLPTKSDLKNILAYQARIFNELAVLK